MWGGGVTNTATASCRIAARNARPHHSELAIKENTSSTFGKLVFVMPSQNRNTEKSTAFKSLLIKKL